MGPEPCTSQRSKVQITRQHFLMNAAVNLFSFSFYSHQVNYVKVNVDQEMDVVTGLKQKTHYGRPNWDKEFEQVRKENPT